MKRREAIRTSLFLTGCGLSAATISSIVSGCQADILGSYVPFLEKNEVRLIAHISETILPKTDTPGAMDALVHETIDQMVRDNFQDEEIEMFRTGLASIDEKSKELYNKNFGKLSALEKEEVLNHIADLGGEQNIFKVMKSLTTYTFFTSEIGAKEVLVYDPIPGRYDPCVSLNEIGGTWAL